MLVLCLRGVDLIEINSFPVSPSLISLPWDSVSSEWPRLVCLGAPGSGACTPLRPGHEDGHRQAKSGLRRNQPGHTTGTVRKSVSAFDAIKSVVL